MTTRQDAKSREGETAASQEPDTAARGPLADHRAWLITDGKAGMEMQVRGVAKALGAAAETKRVSPRAPFRWLAPWGPLDPAERFGRGTGQFAPPWPEIALATGRLSIPALRAVRRASPETFTVIIQDPRTGAASADLIAVPEHDTLSGDNVIRTLTAPHIFAPAHLAALRKAPPADIAKLPGKKVTVVLGGPNAVYRYSQDSMNRLASSLGSLAALGASFLITASRRTPDALLKAVESETANAARIVWNGEGENPYEQFLAQGDVFVVTADSVNMTGEACATGRPVFVFEPEGGSDKFRRFHEALRRYGATRPLADRFSALESWRYTPLDSASQIAREIERRWPLRRHGKP